MKEPEKELRELREKYEELHELVTKVIEVEQGVWDDIFDPDYNWDYNECKFERLAESGPFYFMKKFVEGNKPKPKFEQQVLPLFDQGCL